MTSTNLSPRLSGIAEYLSEGLSNKEIATLTGLSVGTIKMHVKRLFSVLGCTNRTGIAVWWVRHGKPATRTARA